MNEINKPPALPGNRPKPVKRWLLPVLALPVLIRVVGLTIIHVSNNAAIRRLENKARQRGEPLTLQDLEKTYPPVPDAENAAVALLGIWKKEDPDYWHIQSKSQRKQPCRGIN